MTSADSKHGDTDTKADSAPLAPGWCGEGFRALLVQGREGLLVALSRLVLMKLIERGREMVITDLH